MSLSLSIPVPPALSPRLSRSAFLIALFYSAASHWSNLLPRDVAFTVTASFLVSDELRLIVENARSVFVYD